MKTAHSMKLIAALAAVALVGVAHAAKINWSSQGKLWDPATNSYAEEEPSGGTICLCLVVTDADTGATHYEYLQDGNIVRSGYTENIGKVKSYYGYTIPTGKLKDGDILTVLFWDWGDNYSHLYYVDENGQPTGRIVDDTYVVSGISEGLTNLETFTFAKDGNFTTALPEPTSGLLLLVGLAGLALRRRRA